MFIAYVDSQGITRPAQDLSYWCETVEHVFSVHC